MKVSPYPKLVAERYDTTRKDPFPGELEYYMACLEHPGGAVLELTCGSGRLLVPMAKRGINISGIDASPHMLAACERRCSDEGIYPNLHLQKMQELDLGQLFAMIFIGESFNLLVENEDVQAMLNGVYRHLEPGGVLAFDFDSLLSTQELEHPSRGQWYGSWVEATDGTVISSRVNQITDPSTGIWKELHIDEKWASGKLIETESWVCWGRNYSPGTVERFCADAGFVDVRVTAHWDSGLAVDNAEQVSLTCRKPSL